MSLLPVLALLLSAQVAISDLYARRVSNRWLLCVGLGALGGLLWMWVARGAPFPGMHLAGVVVGLAALLPFYALGWMGAGDVKYFAVLGLLLGAPALLPIWIISSLLAGVHALCVLLAPGVRTALPLRMQWLHERAQQHWQAQPFARRIHALRQGRVGIPYAAYLAAATLGYIAWSSNGAPP
ncbi:prepilin peptidase [Bacillus subtilis subsp. subtilis]|nr:prepilin peptidase [Bacillus subtilis subsp. subtilis]